MTFTKVKLLVSYSILQLVIIFGILAPVIAIIFPQYVSATLNNQTLEEIVKQKDVPDIIPQIDTSSRPEYMFLEFFPDTNTMYVSEPDSEAISIISTENNTKIKEIRVEGSPTTIESVDLTLNSTKGEEELDTIFVASPRQIIFLSYQWKTIRK
jgi:hypothetical protein